MDARGRNFNKIFEDGRQQNSRARTVCGPKNGRAHGFPPAPPHVWLHVCVVAVASGPTHQWLAGPLDEHRARRQRTAAIWSGACACVRVRARVYSAVVRARARPDPRDWAARFVCLYHREAAPRSWLVRYCDLASLLKRVVSFARSYLLPVRLRLRPALSNRSMGRPAHSSATNALAASTSRWQIESFARWPLSGAALPMAPCRRLTSAALWQAQAWRVSARLGRPLERDHGTLSRVDKLARGQTRPSGGESGTRSVTWTTWPLVELRVAELPKQLGSRSLSAHFERALAHALAHHTRSGARDLRLIVD